MIHCNRIESEIVVSGRHRTLSKRAEDATKKAQEAIAAALAGKEEAEWRKRRRRFRKQWKRR
jgi:hypothetical protein